MLIGGEGHSVGRTRSGRRGQVYLATGYDKWGMTNAVAVGLTLAGRILGDAPPWAERMHRRLARPRNMVELGRVNAGVGIALARGLTKTELHGTPAASQPKGRATSGASSAYRSERQRLQGSPVRSWRCAPTSVVCSSGTTLRLHGIVRFMDLGSLPTVRCWRGQPPGHFVASPHPIEFMTRLKRVDEEARTIWGLLHASPCR